MLTRLEDLPNELIIEIFDYTKIRDLSCAFWNLNQRFNQLIQSRKYLSLVLTKNEIYENILHAQQIIRLVIVTLADIDFQCFINLRTLKLNLANEKHLKQIRSKFFPNLLYLSLTNSFDLQSTKQLALEVFSNHFSSLRYADLGKIDMPLFSSWSQSPSLRSIVIISPNINIIPLILHSCPRLTHFQVHINAEHDFDPSSFPMITNHPLKQFKFIQSPTSTFVFNIRNLLELIPNLKQIDLRLCTRSFFDLIQFLSQTFLYLTRFDCHIIEYPNKDEPIAINHLRKLHSCYSYIHYTLREDSFSLYATKQIKNP